HGFHRRQREAFVPARVDPDVAASVDLAQLVLRWVVVVLDVVGRVDPRPALAEHHEAHARILLPDELDRAQPLGRSAPRRVAVEHADTWRIVDRPGVVVKLPEIHALHHRAHRILTEAVAKQALQPGRDCELDRRATVGGLDVFPWPAPDLVALDEIDGN